MNTTLKPAKTTTYWPTCTSSYRAIADMGKLIKNHLARLFTLTAASCNKNLRNYFHVPVQLHQLTHPSPTSPPLHLHPLLLLAQTPLRLPYHNTQSLGKTIPLPPNHQHCHFTPASLLRIPCPPHLHQQRSEDVACADRDEVGGDTSLGYVDECVGVSDVWCRGWVSLCLGCLVDRVC